MRTSGLVEGDVDDARDKISAIQGQLEGVWGGAIKPIPDILDIKVVPRKDCSDYLRLILQVMGDAGSEIAIRKLVKSGGEKEVEPAQPASPDAGIEDAVEEAKRKLIEHQNRDGGRYAGILRGLDVLKESTWKPKNRSTGKRLLLHDADLLDVTPQELISSLAKKYVTRQMNGYLKAKEKPATKGGGEKGGKKLEPTPFDKYTEIRFVVHIPGLDYTDLNAALKKLNDIDKDDKFLKDGVEKEKAKLLNLRDAFARDLNAAIAAEFAAHKDLPPASLEALPSAFISAGNITALPDYIDNPPDRKNPSVDRLGIKEYLDLLQQAGVIPSGPGGVEIATSSTEEPVDKPVSTPDSRPKVKTTRVKGGGDPFKDASRAANPNLTEEELTTEEPPVEEEPIVEEEIEEEGDQEISEDDEEE
jgi:hypothetical protein